MIGISSVLQVLALARHIITVSIGENHLSAICSEIIPLSIFQSKSYRRALNG